MVASVAALLNPAGLDVWGYAVGLSSDRNVTARVTEWQPTLPFDGPGLLFYASAVLVAAIVIARRDAVRWPTVVTLASFFLLTVYTQRGLAWWPLVAAVAVAPIASWRTTSDVPGDSRGLRGMNIIVLGALVAAAVILLPMWRPQDRGLRAPAGLLGYAPSGITGQLRTVVRTGDRLFVPQAWASWFEYSFPMATFAVDSRIELFPAAVWADHDQVLAGGTTAPGILDRWGATVVVSSPSNDALPKRLLGAGWKEVYNDPDGTVLVRSDRS
jgi:hypothetical protein